MTARRSLLLAGGRAYRLASSGAMCSRPAVRRGHFGALYAVSAGSADDACDAPDGGAPGRKTFSTVSPDVVVDNPSPAWSKIELVKGGAPAMPAWRKNRFIATSYLSADAAESFCLPRDRTLILGSRIEVGLYFDLRRQRERAPS